MASDVFRRQIQVVYIKECRTAISSWSQLWSVFSKNPGYRGARGRWSRARGIARGEAVGPVDARIRRFLMLIPTQVSELANSIFKRVAV